MVLGMTQRATQRAQQANGLGRTTSSRAAEARDVLHALFCLSRDTQHISAATLGEAVSLTPTQTGAALVLLEQQGLVDASRARLTMKGLVMAMQVGSASGGPRKSGRNAQARKIERALAEQPITERPGTDLPVAALPSERPPQPTSPASSPSSTGSSTFEELRLQLY
jgi:hypothetical protein